MTGDDDTTGAGSSPVTGAADDSEADRDDERLLDCLVDEGVLVERADETLVTSDGFESTHGIYYDSYGDAPEETFERAVSDVFGVPTDEAAARIEDEGVTREMLVTYLAVTSDVDGSYTTQELARMAAMVSEVAPSGPIPADVESLDDETYEAFLDANDRAIVTVWKANCSPCETLKSELPAILDGIPDDVAVGGVDGMTTPGFRRAFEVDSAPALLLFEDGDHLETFRGPVPAEHVVDACERLYG